MKKTNTNELKGYDGIFAKRFRKLMNDTKTKQTALAEKLEVTRQAISTYMDGSALPNVEKLKKICEYFNVSSDYLLGFSGSGSLNAEDRCFSDLTGLNAKSIEVLKSLHNSKALDTEIIIFLLNMILESKPSLMVLSEKMLKYFECYKKYKTENNYENEREYKISQMIAEDWFDDILDDINFYLFNRKDEQLNAKTDK